jgi:hypothetical protein
MSADALFSAEVAKELFDAAPAAARPAHLCCRFCGSDAPGTRERCLRVCDHGLTAALLHRDWTCFGVVCCRACYAKGVALGALRFAAVAWVWLWAAAGPVVGFGLAALDPSPARYATAAAAVVLGFAVPVLLYRAVARRWMERLLGPDREARLRRRLGLTGWGVTTGVGFRPAPPAGEMSLSLDGV